MANPDGVGSAVPPVSPGSGSAVAPVGTTGSDKNTTDPKPVSTGKGVAGSPGGTTLPPVAPDRVETNPLHFKAIDAALMQVNAAVAAREELFKSFRDAEDSKLAPSIIEFRLEKYERAFDVAEQALAVLGAEIEKKIVGGSYNGPFIHPRSTEEWRRADSIAADYWGQKGVTYVSFLANQLRRVVDGVRTLSEDIAKDPTRWNPSDFDGSGTLYDAADIVTRRRPDESEAQHWDNQFLRLACLLVDVRKNTDIDQRIFAKLVIHCAEAMGISSQKDLDRLEGIVGRYNNPEIADWIKEARRLAQ